MTWSEVVKIPTTDGARSSGDETAHSGEWLEHPSNAVVVTCHHAFVETGGEPTTFYIGR